MKALPISKVQLKHKVTGRSLHAGARTAGAASHGQGGVRGSELTLQIPKQISVLKSTPPPEPQRAFTLIALSVNCLAILYLSNLGEEIKSWEIPRFNSTKEKQTSRQREERTSDIRTQETPA